MGERMFRYSTGGMRSFYVAIWVALSDNLDSGGCAFAIHGQLVTLAAPSSHISDSISEPDELFFLMLPDPRFVPTVAQWYCSHIH